MADMFGSIMGMGMNPAVTDLYKQAKKRLNRGMTPQIQKKDGTVGPGMTNQPVQKGPSIWERITSGV